VDDNYHHLALAVDQFPDLEEDLISEVAEAILRALSITFVPLPFPRPWLLI
jgi:hypothetical protein